MFLRNVLDSRYLSEFAFSADAEVKISAPGLEEAVAGTQLLAAWPCFNQGHWILGSNRVMRFVLGTGIESFCLLLIRIMR